MPEEKEGLQTEENTGDADSQTDTGTPEKTEEEIDWKKRYTDLQADSTQKSQRLAKLEQDAQEREEREAAQREEDAGYGENYVDRKTVDQLIKTEVSKAESRMRLQTADAYFRRTYPDIVKHENVISGIMRNPTDPKMLKKGVTVEERIDSAVKEFNELTKEAVNTAKEEADKESKEREEKNRKAAGLGGTSTAPSKSEDEGKSDEDELKDRKARQAKKRSLA